jgi:hypothetical protein
VKLDVIATGTRRGGTGGGMSSSGEWTRWWRLLYGWGGETAGRVAVVRYQEEARYGRAGEAINVE